MWFAPNASWCSLAGASSSSPRRSAGPDNCLTIRGPAERRPRRNVSIAASARIRESTIDGLRCTALQGKRRVSGSGPRHMTTATGLLLDDAVRSMRRDCWRSDPMPRSCGREPNRQVITPTTSGTTRLIVVGTTTAAAGSGVATAPRQIPWRSTARRCARIRSHHRIRRIAAGRRPPYDYLTIGAADTATEGISRLRNARPKFDERHKGNERGRGGSTSPALWHCCLHQRNRRGRCR
jgi:hypothetical protein